jgi:hypothetical protein
LEGVVHTPELAPGFFIGRKQGLTASEAVKLIFQDKLPGFVAFYIFWLNSYIISFNTFFSSSVNVT